MRSRLAVLFLVAFVGVVAMLTVVAASLGPVVLPAFLVLIAVGVGLLVRAVRRQPPEDGRTCTCCTSTVHDPVEVR